MAKASKETPVPLLEWVSAALGLGIALALMGIIGREAILSEKGSDLPILYARVQSVEATKAGHAVRIIVFNRSRQTAARVEVEGKAGNETSLMSVDYVAGRSQAEGGLVFQEDPRRAGLKVRVTGFQLP